MSFLEGNQTPLPPPGFISNPSSEHSKPAQYVNLCLKTGTFDDLCIQLEKAPIPLRIDVYEALHLLFQSHDLHHDLSLDFSNVSLYGIFFGSFKESSTIVSDHVQNILQQSTFNELNEQFCLIPLNLRAEVHAVLFKKALWSHKQTDLIQSLNISTDLYGVDIQLTETDQEASHFQNNLFDALDEFNFIAQFRQIPLQYRSSVYKVLLHTLQQDQQSAEFRDWVYTIRAADLYIDFDDIAQRISEEAHIYANACFRMSPESESLELHFNQIPLAIGGQVYQAACFQTLMLPHRSYPFAACSLLYLKHKPGPLRQLDILLNAPNYDAFISQFLTIDYSRRLQIHNDLYFYTKSDLVKYKEQFDWVLQCTHPYYFAIGFGDDDLESESNQAVKCAHDFLVNPGHRDAIFAQFSQFTKHSSRFEFCLSLASKTSYKWMSSHLDLQRYIDLLYPELVSATDGVKECVGRCLLASNLGEFKVAFHSVPFSMRHEVYSALSFCKDYYYEKQQNFLNALQPFEVSINVNHYISDDQLAIYAIACSSAQDSGDFLSSVPCSIRAQIYRLALLLHTKPCYLDTGYSSYLWSVSTRSQAVECLNADNFDQFKSRFLSIPRKLRSQEYDALYIGTQNDRSKFIWLLQCTHPYYFLDGFDDNAFKSQFDAEFSETFLVHFDRDDVYDTFSRLPQSSRFDLFLKLASQVSYTWLTSHTDKLPRYLSCLYPEFTTVTEEVKECVGRCLLASNLGEFKVTFLNIPFSTRREVHNALPLYQHCFHEKQQDFLNALHPLEVTVDVNHYISDDQLAIYTTACCSVTNMNGLKDILSIIHDLKNILFIIPYPIRAQIYKLTSEQAKFDFNTDSALHDLSHLWKAPAITCPTLEVDECLSSDSFDQFKSKFLSISRQLRPKAYEELYVGTQNDRSKFIWLLQCTHPYYFLNGFDDNDVDDGVANGEQQH